MEYFLARHSLDSISLEIVNRHTLSYVQVCAVNGNPASYSDWDSCLCERSLTQCHLGLDLPNGVSFRPTFSMVHE